MRKKFAVVICAVCVLALTMGLLVGCGDDKPSGETDPIVGTWIGTEQSEVYTRHFYVKITYKEERAYATTTGERGTHFIFNVDAKIVSAKGTVALTEQEAWENSKVENRYNFSGDFSPLPHNYPDKLKYNYILDLSNDILTMTGEEKRGTETSQKIIYTFNRTTLTIEQFQEQLKVAQA